MRPRPARSVPLLAATRSSAGTCRRGSAAWRERRRPGVARAAAAATALSVAAASAAALFRYSSSEAFADGGLSDAGSVALLRPLLQRREWRLCASHEGGVCHCTGTAAFHSWMGDWAMLRHVNGSIRCSAERFGNDPRPGLVKVCSCRDGPAWPDAVGDGLNHTIARKLLPRVEVGPAEAGCGPEDDAAWTACAVMSSRYDASLVPDRLLPRLPPDEQQDVAFRKLDLCHHLAGPDQALRILGVWPSSIPLGVVPVKASSAPVCAVVYRPGLGPVWNSRAAVFCPTDPPRCLEGTCECADSGFSPVDIRNQSKSQESGPPCWTCLPPQSAEQSPREDGSFRGSSSPAPASWRGASSPRTSPSSVQSSSGGPRTQVGAAAAAGER
eukprot:TRINITY_DN20112_c0_g1_i1.p1 TRINITY_DN20112_c0_g1~~TRINITY_DN20112_c0_g1_i1.p1  ORF type:complete len:384 (-),score=53.80 TRINITY_DN20112_c0_g1_i1:28-1179(-)